MPKLTLTWVLVLMLWPFTAAAAQAPPAGTVLAVEGDARVTRGDSPSPLHAGDPVFRNDILDTAAAARLSVRLADGTDITAGPSAEIAIDDFVYNPGSDSNNIALRLTNGAARMVSGAIARANRKAVAFTTPVAVIGIRGTDFFAEMHDGHLAAALFSGFEITVTNTSGTTVLRPGEGADVWQNQSPSHRQTWSTARINRALALVTVGSPLPYARPVAVAATPDEALTGGKFKLDIRYRYESVDQAGLPRSGYSNTLRLRLGYETLAWNGLFAGIEGNLVRDIGGVRRNDGVTVQPGIPLIADPESERLEQAYVGWSLPAPHGDPLARIEVGRHRFAYEDERWIGSSDFRQTDQTFDAVTFETRPFSTLDVRYAYVSRVNRILGDNPGGVWTSDSHLIGVSTTVVPFGVTTAYAYLLDLKPVPALSSATTGLRYDGSLQTGAVKFGLEAEIARQTDYGNNPNQYALIYSLLRPSVGAGGTTLSAEWESLRGNGRFAVQTPLATFHAQNGWAEMFNTIPSDGLRDLRLRWLQDIPDIGPLKNAKLDVRFDDFAATHGSIHYGREVDADVNGSLKGWLTVGFQIAAYRASGFASDTTKLWLYAEVLY